VTCVNLAVLQVAAVVYAPTDNYYYVTLLLCREAGQAEGAAEEEVTSELRQLTLDEWKALQQTGRQPARTVFNIRKPGEGCKTDPQWNRMERLRKTSDETEKLDTAGQFDDAVSVC